MSTRCIKEIIVNIPAAPAVPGTGDILTSLGSYNDLLFRE